MLGACTGPFQSSSPSRKPTPASREARAYENYIYRGDVARTGVYDAGGGPYFGDVLWQFKEDSYSRAPVIAGGLAFVNTSDSGLLVVDLKTGLLQYTLHSKYQYSIVPTVADGVLYYETSDGLHARDIATGNENWVYESEFVGSSPVVYEGMVYFGISESPGYSGAEGYLVAVDAANGQEKWRFKASMVNIPAVGDGMIYFEGGEVLWQGDFSQSHTMLHAVDLQSGKEVWHLEAPGTTNQPESYGLPIYYDGLIYAVTSSNSMTGTENGVIHAFDAKTGKQVWEQAGDTPLWQVESPLAYNGTIYAVTGTSDTLIGTLRAFDAKTGKTKWTFEALSPLGAPALYEPDLNEPIISNDVLYMSASVYRKNQGVLYSIDPQTGAQLDKKDFDHVLTYGSAIAEGVLYVQGRAPGPDGEFIGPDVEYLLDAVSTLPVRQSVPGASAQPDSTRSVTTATSTPGR
jgi:outer membrane protein assembly factor BamB